MFAVKQKPEIVIRWVMIVMMLYVLIASGNSTSSRDGQIDLGLDSDTNSENISSENSQFTEKESRVISLLLKGKSNSQIASQLGVCTRTIEYHLSRIYQRLGIGSRAEAIVKLIHLFKK